MIERQFRQATVTPYGLSRSVAKPRASEICSALSLLKSIAFSSSGIGGRSAVEVAEDSNDFAPGLKRLPNVHRQFVSRFRLVGLDSRTGKQTSMLVGIPRR